MSILKARMQESVRAFAIFLLEKVYFLIEISIVSMISYYWIFCNHFWLYFVYIHKNKALHFTFSYAAKSTPFRSEVYKINIRKEEKTMRKNFKRTVLALMMVSMLASSALMVPAFADDGSVATMSEEQNTGLPAAKNGVITLANGEYTLTANITDRIVVPEGVTATINLGDCNITGSSDHTIYNKGTLTINGTGTISNEGKGNYGALFNTVDAIVNLNGGTFTDGNWYTIKNLGTMTIDGATVTRTGGDTKSSLIANGWYNASGSNANDCEVGHASSNAKLTIKNGTFDGGMNVVKNDDCSELVINGGTFSNTSDVVIMNWNVATINGGIFTANNSAVITNGYLGAQDVGQLTITGGTFTVKENGTGSLLSYGSGACGGGELNISGGAFNGALPGNLPYTTEISGGTYSSDPSAYLDDSVEAVLAKSGDSGFEVYDDLQNAVNAAKAGDTVTTQKSDLSATVDPSKGIIFTAKAETDLPTLTTSDGQNVAIGEDGKTTQTTYAAKVNGTSANYKPGETVTIAAEPYIGGHVFSYWKVVSGNVTLDNSYASTTTFIMPAGNVEVEAVYENYVYIPDYTPAVPSVTVTKKDGWNKSGKTWYYYEDGVKEKGWLKLKNTWYYLDPKTGAMYDDGLAEIDGGTYYFYSWGGMANSFWYLDEETGDWYFFRGNGAMAKNAWIEWKGEYYYVGRDGAMLTNTVTPDGYTVDRNGVWVK